MSWQHASPPSRALCFKGAQGHSGRPICTPTSAVRCRFRLLATLLLIGLLSSTTLHQTHPSATQLSYSRSRAPVFLRVLPVPERVPCQPYPCHCCFPSSPTRPLLLVFVQVYRAACLSVSALDAFSARDRRSFSEILTASATAQHGQRSDTFQPQLTISCVPADL